MGIQANRGPFLGVKRLALSKRALFQVEKMAVKDVDREESRQRKSDFMVDDAPGANASSKVTFR